MAAPEPMTLEALREYAAGLGLALQPVDAAPPYETAQSTPVALPGKTVAFTRVPPPTKAVPAQTQVFAPTQALAPTRAPPPTQAPTQPQAPVPTKVASRPRPVMRPPPVDDPLVANPPVTTPAVSVNRAVAAPLPPTAPQGLMSTEFTAPTTRTTGPVRSRPHGPASGRATPISRPPSEARARSATPAVSVRPYQHGLTSAENLILRQELQAIR
ncbi:hypothetical protein FS749_008824 [Ceratobasidium sp. UAMH 11750]|nr:hypothetical protein FS749_008824 [Ceratobasidium sp. UAMH 11750]